MGGARQKGVFSSDNGLFYVGDDLWSWQTLLELAFGCPLVETIFNKLTIKVSLNNRYHFFSCC